MVSSSDHVLGDGGQGFSEIAAAAGRSVAAGTHLVVLDEPVGATGGHLWDGVFLVRPVLGVSSSSSKESRDHKRCPAASSCCVTASLLGSS